MGWASVVTQATQSAAPPFRSNPMGNDENNGDENTPCHPILEVFSLILMAGLAVGLIVTAIVEVTH